MQVSYEPTTRTEMLDFVPRNATSFLEIGCGRSRFAAAIKGRQACTITAIEPDEAMAREALETHDHIVVAPVEEALKELGQKFECILLIDVLEHLVDPWGVLRELEECLLEDGTIVASIPNMRFYHALKGLVLYGDWEYDKSGVKDITHLRFFTKKSMVRMFERAGYTVTRIAGINEIELPTKWRMLTRLFPDILEDVRFRQFACVAVKKS